MSWFSQIFRSRPKLAPGSNLPEPALGRAIVALSASLEKEGYSVIPAGVQNTNSMLPTFDANALLLIEFCSLGDCRAGDILLRGTSGLGRIAHRATRPFGENWECQGDNNKDPDTELVTKANFRGRVCGILFTQKTATTDS